MITGYYESPIVFHVVSWVKRRKEEKIVSSTVKILRRLQRTSCPRSICRKLSKNGKFIPEKRWDVFERCGSSWKFSTLGDEMSRKGRGLSLHEFAMKPLHTTSCVTLTGIEESSRTRAMAKLWSLKRWQKYLESTFTFSSRILRKIEKIVSIYNHHEFQFLSLLSLCVYVLLILFSYLLDLSKVFSERKKEKEDLSLSLDAIPPDFCSNGANRSIKNRHAEWNKGG